ncbi:MAG: FAD-binding oxidoreductase [Thermodesulfobacteriota bacterium]
MSERREFEVIVVGTGIAGASLAYFLAEQGCTDVLLLERERSLAYHSTGRSAATLSAFDMNPTLLALKVASAPFFRDPPAGFAENPLLKRTGVLGVFPEPAWSMVREAASILRDEGLRFELLTAEQVLARVPLLDPREFAGGVLVPDDGRLDVHEILSSYLRHARRRGVELRLAAEVRSVVVEGGRCRGVVTADGELRARLVVDAAGAWAGTVARMAGASAIPLVPHRRTIVVFPPPDGVEIGDWPMVASDAHQLYFAPEAGDLMLSPMDEEPMEPCDATPDDTVVAAGLERFARLAPRLRPRTLKRKWSGLRTFSPDRVHVVGEDPKLPGFFWLGGQGGCGIETSPVIGRVAADLVVRGRSDAFDTALLSPERFALSS